MSWRIAFLALFVFAACDGSSSDGGKDSGPRADAATPDAATARDAGSGFDAAVSGDAGRHDAALPDAGARHDAGHADAGDRDAHTQPDAGSGEHDSGHPDDPKDHDLAALCVSCASDQKLCDGLCVAKLAANGCGDSRCTACQLPHAAAKCGEQGDCIIDKCHPGWSDCDGSAANGCEADLSAPETCGGCGEEHECSGPSALCASTGCVGSCVPPLTQCGERCVDLLTATAACGSCDQVCESGDAPTQSHFPVCALATCSHACTDGYTRCTDKCVDLMTAASDCGACGHSCASGQACVGGACVAALCQSGWKNCAGSCVAPQTDAMNCGRCGRSCSAEQSCVAGSCVLTSSQWLQTGLHDPLDLLVDGENLFWIERGEDNGKVMRGSKQGGEVVPLATGLRRPMSLVADSSYVYWSNNLGGAVMRAPKDGSAAASLVTAATSPKLIAVDDTYVYLARTSAVERVAKAGGSLEAFAAFTSMNVQNVFAFAVDASGIYALTDVTSSWAVWHIDAAGSVTHVHSDPNGDKPFPLFVTTDVDSIYVAHQYDQRSSFGIKQISKSNADDVMTFVSARVRPMSAELPLRAFAIADCGALWTDGNDLYLGRSGYPYQAALAHGQMRALALDASYVYWTDGSGAIGRVAKP